MNGWRVTRSSGWTIYRWFMIGILQNLQLARQKTITVITVTDHLCVSLYYMQSVTPLHTHVTALMIFLASKFSTGLCDTSIKQTWRWNVDGQTGHICSFINYLFCFNHKMHIKTPRDISSNKMVLCLDFLDRKTWFLNIITAMMCFKIRQMNRGTGLILHTELIFLL